MTGNEFNVIIATLADQFAQAIALAEGFFVDGSLPSRINNPGDLELGDRGYGIEQGKTIYFTVDDGWAALKRECIAMLTGASRAYSVNDSFEQVAAKWTGGDNPGPWVKIVTGKLNVDPMDTLAQWVKAASEQEG